TAAAFFSVVVPGCGTDATSPEFALEDHGITHVSGVVNDLASTIPDDPADTLRRSFPEHAANVLDQPTTSARHSDGQNILVDPMWTTAAPLSVARGFGVAVTLQNGKVLVMGGYNGAWTGVADLYDPATNMWTSAGTSYPSYGHEATLLNDGRVIV